MFANTLLVAMVSTLELFLAEHEDLKGHDWHSFTKGLAGVMSLITVPSTTPTGGGELEWLTRCCHYTFLSMPGSKQVSRLIKPPSCLSNATLVGFQL